MADETHFADGPGAFSTPAKVEGRIGRRVNAALDRFIAAGEPEPK
jgi:hypothetical protein